MRDFRGNKNGRTKRRLVKAWSKEEVKSLRTFAREKLSGSQAAKKLRRTPGAVAQKAMKTENSVPVNQTESSLASPSTIQERALKHRAVVAPGLLIAVCRHQPSHGRCESRPDYSTAQRQVDRPFVNTRWHLIGQCSSVTYQITYHRSHTHSNGVSSFGE